MSEIVTEISSENKIKLLSQDLSNQIAAGEVIERPASIVKELLENSLDAGSDKITITINQSGHSLISITDNGVGINKDDLRLAVTQHATSKIDSIDDLTNIHSLGFRGEALASICAVAKLSIYSRAKQEVNKYDTAWMIGPDYQVAPAAHPIGTTIEVRDLFYSIPVRRRFLKSDRTEYQHILDIFNKIALSNFNCAFTLIHDDRKVYRFSRADNKQAQNNRIRNILGRGFIDSATYFESSAEGLAIKGWLGNPGLHRSQSDQQYFFLNGRVIRDKLILHALKMAYNNYIPQGRHPCYVLYLTIDTKEVDVNVHPTKHEVRFCEPHWVYQFINLKISDVLSKTCSNVDGNSDINIDINSDMSLSNKNFGSSAISKLSTPYTPSSISTLSTQKNYIKLDDNTDEKIIHQKDNHGSIVLRLNNHYVITSNDNDFYLVNITRAYSRLIYFELTSEYNNKGRLISSDLLITAELPIDNLIYDLINNLIDSNSNSAKILAKLGFKYQLKYIKNNTDLSEQSSIITSTGEELNTIEITAVPEICLYADYEMLFRLCLEAISSQHDLEKYLDQLFYKMASLDYARFYQALLLQEQQAILDKLAKIDYNGSSLSYFTKNSKYNYIKQLDTSQLDHILNE